MNRKGFTLIELLAAIVVMGIFMTVSIYGGSTIIKNSKKSLYVSNAKEFLKSAQYEILKNHKRYAINDTDVTYYIHINNFELEKNLGSPWGKWTDAYVVVGLTKSGQYEYAWTSKDEANYTIRLEREEALTREDVILDDRALIKYPLGDRKYVVVIGDDGVVTAKTFGGREVTKQEAEKCFDYTITESDKTAKITSYKTTCGTDVDIPASIDGYLVNIVGSRCFKDKGLTSVNIPETVTSIYDYAFDSNHLTSVILPPNLKTLSYNSFSNNSITEVSFPSSSLTMIREHAFENNQLIKVTIPDSVTSIATSAFANNKLTEVDLPQSVKSISEKAFVNNQLTKVVLPSKATYIGNDAFKNNLISQVTFPTTTSKVTIGKDSFRKNKLTTVNLPNYTSVGACAFCENPITKPVFWYTNSTHTIIGGYVSDLSIFPNQQFVIPATSNGKALQSIADDAFYGLNLENWSVVIPSTVTSIGSKAFDNTKIGSVNIFSQSNPGSVALKTIKSFAFYGNHLQTLYIPSSVTSIETGAFNKNQVTTGDKVIYKRVTTGDHIDYSSIIGYSGTGSIYLPEKHGTTSLTTIGEYAYGGGGLTGTITIPSTVTSIGKRAFNANNLTDVVNGEGDNDGIPIVYARNSSKPGGYDSTKIVSYGGSETASVSIPSGVTSINTSAFYGSHIKSITLPSGLTSIGETAFALCDFTTVTIPSSVTTIGDYAFSSDNKLTKIINKTGKKFPWYMILSHTTRETQSVTGSFQIDGRTVVVSSK